MASIVSDIEVDRVRQAAEARAELLRRAKELGIKPVSSLTDLAGDPEITAGLDVDAFLKQVREDRDRSSTRSRE